VPNDRVLRTPWVIAAIVLLIAAETRFLGLDLRSLWFDEAFSVNLAHQSIAAIVQFLPRNDTHPPLYYILLGGWIRLFGSSESAVRGLSALAGVLMIPLLYAFARQMVEADVALVAAALLAGSAFATVAAQEARMYPLLGLLALISWSSLRRGVQAPRVWPWLVYVVSSALMLYTHYFGFLVLGSQILYLLPLARHNRRTLLPAALAVGTIAVLFLPWVPTFVVHATSGRAYPTFRQPVGPGVVVDLLALYGFGGELFGAAGYFHGAVLPLWKESFLVAPILCLISIGAYAIRGERARCLLCYWAAPVAMALVLSIRHNLFYTRYFSFLAPAFALLGASGIAAVAGMLVRAGGSRAQGRSAIMASLVAALLIANTPVINGYRWRGAGDYNWRDAAAFVSRKAGTNDYLVFVPGFAHIPFEYYYKGHLGRYELTPVETYRSVRMEIPPTMVDPVWARSLAEAHPRLWIVATMPLTGRSFERLGDLLGASFMPERAWDFNDVYIFALTSRLYHGGAGSQ
jgi:mannosyltransferase